MVQSQFTILYHREVLSSQQLVDFLASRQCLCWAVSVNSEEGARVSYTLRETTYPFLAFVIVLKGTRMTIIGRQEGMCNGGIGSSHHLYRSRHHHHRRPNH